MRLVKKTQVQFESYLVMPIYRDEHYKYLRNFLFKPWYSIP